MKINTLDFDTQDLREKILDLAMRGKLVPQDSNDKPADFLLNKVKLRENKRRASRSKPLPVITDDEKPFVIPDSWEWIRLGSVVDVSSGKKLAQKNLNEEFKYPVFGANGLIGYFKKYNILSKKILIGRVGSVGKINIAMPQTWVTDNALVVNIKVEAILSFKWLEYILKASKLGELASHTSQPVISATKVKNKIIALPPLAEQKRIANKVSQLFDQIDKIESASQQYTELQSSLRSKVLDVAMHGKLVKQNSSDEPAGVLLDKIKSEKDKLVKEKKIRKSKTLPKITDDEKPFDIPDSWDELSN